jgi:hypothetical protein
MSISISVPNIEAALGGVVTVTQAIAAAQNKPALLNNMAAAARMDPTAIPTLVNDLAALDPSLVAPVQAKALLASKTPIGVIIAYGIAWATAKYGFGLDPNTISLLAGGVVLLAAYGMRYVTNAPIGGIVSTK